MQSANLPLVKRGPSPLRPLKGFCLAPEHAEQAPLQRQLILQSCWLEGSSAFHHTSRHLRHRSTHAPLRMQPKPERFAEAPRRPGACGSPPFGVDVRLPCSPRPSWNRRRLGRWESIGLVVGALGDAETMGFHSKTYYIWVSSADDPLSLGQTRSASPQVVFNGGPDHLIGSVLWCCSVTVVFF